MITNTHVFFKIIHFSMQFSAIANRFIVKTLLNSTFTNDLKRKLKKSKNVHSCRLSLFNLMKDPQLLKIIKGPMLSIITLMNFV